MDMVMTCGGKRIAFLGCLLASCLPLGSGEDREEPEALGVRREALAAGIQGMAEFDASGAALPGAITTLGTSIDALKTGTGRYTVTFHFLAATSPTTAGQGGTLQVVAVGADNVRCTLASNWSYTASHDVVGTVACRSPGVGAADSGFYVSYGRGPASSGRAAYARVNADATVPSETSWSSSGATITAQHPGVGTYWVHINAETREAVQVTAVSATHHCHASLREMGITTVLCFDDTGAPADTKFTIHQAGTDGIGLAGLGAFAELRRDGTLSGFYEFDACPLGTTSSSRIGVGRYTVTHTLLAKPPFSYQLGAYGDGSQYCKIDHASPPGTGTTATVTAQCYSAAGTATDSALLESYSIYLGDCGGCTHDCQGGACVLGVCQPVTLASGDGIGPRSVAANASNVWFTNDPGPTLSGGFVMTVPRGGGGVTPLATFGSVGHWATFDSMVVGPSYVYWYEAASSGAGVYRKPLSGGARSLFAAGGSDPQPRALALVGSDLYFGDAFASQLFRIDSLGTRTPLLPNPPPPPTTNYYPFNIAADSTRVYFVKDSGGIVYGVPLTGGTPTQLSTPTLTTPHSGLATSAIATDGTSVYFATSQASGTIFKVPVTGGVTTTFADAGGLVTGMAISGGTLFFTVKSPGAVKSKALSGGTIQTLASGQNAPSSIFVDSSSIFWTTADAVRKLAR
jgi:hypothetical protein